MGRKLCHSQLTGENKMKRVDAEIRLQGQCALHLPSRSSARAAPGLGPSTPAGLQPSETQSAINLARA